MSLAVTQGFNAVNTLKMFNFTFIEHFPHLLLRLMNPTFLETQHSTWPAIWVRTLWPLSWWTSVPTSISPTFMATPHCIWLLPPPAGCSVSSCLSTTELMSTCRWRAKENIISRTMVLLDRQRIKCTIYSDDDGLCNFESNMLFKISLFNRIKKGRALCIWLPSMVVSQGPRYWSKMVTEITENIYLPLKHWILTAHRLSVLSNIKHVLLLNIFIITKCPSAFVHRWWDWLCWHLQKHSSSCCCQIRSRAADQHSPHKWSRQGQVCVSSSRCPQFWLTWPINCVKHLIVPCWLLFHLVFICFPETQLWNYLMVTLKELHCIWMLDYVLGHLLYFFLQRCDPFRHRCTAESCPDKLAL